MCDKRREMFSSLPECLAIVPKMSLSSHYLQFGISDTFHLWVRPVVLTGGQGKWEPCVLACLSSQQQGNVGWRRGCLFPLHLVSCDSEWQCSLLLGGMGSFLRGERQFLSLSWSSCFVLWSLRTWDCLWGWHGNGARAEATPFRESCSCRMFVGYMVD